MGRANQLTCDDLRLAPMAVQEVKSTAGHRWDCILVVNTRLRGVGIYECVFQEPKTFPPTGNVSLSLNRHALDLWDRVTPEQRVWSSPTQ